ncbi:MAG: helix-turn-helix domain-containing protein, partial [Clostridia bacterium]|nr:helix-turn-helix domain-containing protein [Clostridia bacterium]
METVGSILRQRREALGLSLEEVQNRTKIRIRYLDALERGDYALLPGEVYARGFLRAYAEVLEIDPQPLLERLRREWGGLPATSEEPGSSGRELPAGRPAAAEEETPPWRATPPQAERPGAAADEGLPGGGPTLPPRSRAPRPA